MAPAVNFGAFIPFGGGGDIWSVFNNPVSALHMISQYRARRLMEVFGPNRSDDDEKRPARSRRGKSKRANLKEDSSSESERERSSREKRKTKESEKEKESEEDVDEDETPPSSDEDVSSFLHTAYKRLLSCDGAQNYYKRRMHFC
jgi:hypothetical protein